MFALLLLFSYTGALPTKNPIPSACSVSFSCWEDSNQNLCEVVNIYTYYLMYFSKETETQRMLWSECLYPPKIIVLKS